MFNPNQSVLELKIFKVTLFVLIFLSILSAYFIATSLELKLSLTYEGFNNFFNVFKFPLSMLALIIPSVALIATNHRSEQTREQIRVTNNQNNFTNYYKHIEEFDKYHMQVNKVDKFILSYDIRYLHSVIFDQSKGGIYEPNKQLMSEMVLYSHSVFKLFSLAKNDDESRLSTLSKFMKTQEDFHAKYKVSSPKWSSTIHFSNIGVPDSVYEMLASVIILAVEINSLYKFNTSYVETRELSDLINFDLSKYHNLSVYDWGIVSSKNFLEELIAV